MKKLLVVLPVLGILTACGQLTSNQQERAGLQATSTAKGDSYVECIRQKALDYTSQNSSDVTMIVQLASAACQSELDAYRSAEKAYLETQVMMTDKPLEASVAALNKRASTEVGQIMLTRPAAPAAAAATATAAVAAPAATRQLAAPAEGWNAQQRIYLDCMEAQAGKYAGLNESAAVIADVAQSKCKSYIGAANPALEQEGRSQAMAAVLDARLAAPAR
jgi:hypothetical protein